MPVGTWKLGPLPTTVPDMLPETSVRSPLVGSTRNTAFRLDPPFTTTSWPPNSNAMPEGPWKFGPLPVLASDMTLLSPLTGLILITAFKPASSTATSPPASAAMLTGSPRHGLMFSLDEMIVRLPPAGST